MVAGNHEAIPSNLFLPIHIFIPHMREKDTDHSTPDCSPGVTRLDTNRKGTMMEVRRHSDDSNDVVEHREHFGKLKDSTSSFLRTLDKWRKDTDFSLYPL